MKHSRILWRGDLGPEAPNNKARASEDGPAEQPAAPVIPVVPAEQGPAAPVEEQLAAGATIGVKLDQGAQASAQIGESERDAAGRITEDHGLRGGGGCSGLCW